MSRVTSIKATQDGRIWRGFLDGWLSGSLRGPSPLVVCTSSSPSRSLTLMKILRCTPPQRIQVVLDLSPLPQHRRNRGARRFPRHHRRSLRPQHERLRQGDLRLCCSRSRVDKGSSVVRGDVQPCLVPRSVGFSDQIPRRQQRLRQVRPLISSSFNSTDARQCSSTQVVFGAYSGWTIGLVTVLLYLSFIHLRSLRSTMATLHDGRSTPSSQQSAKGLDRMYQTLVRITLAFAIIACTSYPSPDEPKD